MREIERSRPESRQPNGRRPSRPHKSRRGRQAHYAAVALLAVVVLLFPACGPPKRRGGWPLTFEDVHPRPEMAASEAVGDGETAGAVPSELPMGEREKLRRGEYALRVNRTLIYPVRWLRAEDVAESLRPLLESRHGPGVRIVAHPESNSLLIYLPPVEHAKTTPTPAR